MSFAKIDHWIGKTLFVPPIIKLCQLTRQSQFAVSRLFWFIAALDGFYRAETVFGSILWGGISVVMMVSAAWRADSPTASFMLFRLVAVLLLVLDLIKGAATGEWAGFEFWVFILVAEYAAIIRTIPPKEAPRTRSQGDRCGVTVGPPKERQLPACTPAHPLLATNPLLPRRYPRARKPQSGRSRAPVSSCFC